MTDVFIGLAALITMPITIGILAVLLMELLQKSKEGIF